MSDSQEANNIFSVTLVNDIETKKLQVRDTDIIYNVITNAFKCREEDIREVQFGDDLVVSGDSFEDHRIEDGGRLSVAIVDNTELNNQNCIARIGSENLKKDKPIKHGYSKLGDYWYFAGPVPGGPFSILTTGELIDSECYMDKYLKDNNYEGKETHAWNGYEAEVTYSYKDTEAQENRKKSQCIIS